MPSHLATPSAVMPPAFVKAPPTYKSVPESASANTLGVQEGGAPVRPEPSADQLLLIAARQLAGQRRSSDARDAYLRAQELPAFDWDTMDALDQCLVVEVGVALLRAGDASSHEKFCQSWFDRIETSGTPRAAASVAVNPGPWGRCGGRRGPGSCSSKWRQATPPRLRAPRRPSPARHWSWRCDRTNCPSSRNRGGRLEGRAVAMG